MTEAASRIDYEAEGLLADATGDDERAARIRLLDELVAAGVGLERLRAAVAEHRLATLPVELLFTRGCTRRLREVLDEVGLSEDYVRRHHLALGVPMPELDEAALTDDDVVAWRMTKAMFDAGLSEDAMLEMTRVSGRGAAQVAAVSVQNLIGVLLRRGDTELDVATRLAQVTGDLAPVMGPLSETPLRWHVRERIRHEVIGRTERETGRLAGTSEVAVGFADLVDFTRLSAGLSVERLHEATGRFEQLAAEVAEAPVHLVKLIGDEAMLVSDDPGALVAALRGLVAATEADDCLPRARAGAALGRALNRGGDWYGRPVNLASRITGVADPGALFADAALAQRTVDVLEWAPAGEHALKGFDEPAALHRLEAVPGD